MLKKNNSEIRFNTAGARIPMSRKLPSDFFKPISTQATHQSSNLFTSHQNHITLINNSNNSIIYPKDPLQFTFRRSNSQQYHSLHEKSMNKQINLNLNINITHNTNTNTYNNNNHKKYYWLKKQNKKSLMKLPPIINFHLLRETNQSAKKFVMKLNKKTTKKISEELKKSYQHQKENVEN